MFHSYLHRKVWIFARFISIEYGLVIIDDPCSGTTPAAHTPEITMTTVQRNVGHGSLITAYWEIRGSLQEKWFLGACEGGDVRTEQAPHWRRANLGQGGGEWGGFFLIEIFYAGWIKRSVYRWGLGVPAIKLSLRVHGPLDKPGNKTISSLLLRAAGLKTKPKQTWTHSNCSPATGKKVTGKWSRDWPNWIHQKAADPEKRGQEERSESTTGAHLNRILNNVIQNGAGGGFCGGLRVTCIFNGYNDTYPLNIFLWLELMIFEIKFLLYLHLWTRNSYYPYMYHMYKYKHMYTYTPAFDMA